MSYFASLAGRLGVSLGGSARPMLSAAALLLAACRLDTGMNVLRPGSGQAVDIYIASGKVIRIAPGALSGLVDLAYDPTRRSLLALVRSNQRLTVLTISDGGERLATLNVEGNPLPNSRFYLQRGTTNIVFGDPATHRRLIYRVAGGRLVFQQAVDDSADIDEELDKPATRRRRLALLESGPPLSPTDFNPWGLDIPSDVRPQLRVYPVLTGNVGLPVAAFGKRPSRILLAVAGKLFYAVKRFWALASLCLHACLLRHAGD